MSESKHTPGPWKAICNDVPGGVRPVGDDGVRYWTVEMPWDAGDKYRGSVCHVFAAVHIGGITLPERDANARLIAAAPDMLEALHSINKIASPNPNRTFDDVIRDLDFIMDRARRAIAKAEGRSDA